MKQAQLLKVIDAWSDAVAALTPHVPPEAIARLNAATGDLLTAFAETAMDLTTGAAADVRAQLAALSMRVHDIEDQQLDAKEVS